MIRRWSFMRLTLAALVVWVMPLTVALWPRQPYWRLPGESFLGLDESRGLIYSSKPEQTTDWEVRGGTALLPTMQPRIAVRDLKTGRERATLPFTWPGKSSPTLLMAPTGSALAAFSTVDDTISLLPLPAGQPCYRLPLPPPLPSRSGELEALGFTPDGRFLVAYTTGRLSVWDTQTGESRYLIDASPGAAAGSLRPILEEVDSTADGKLLAIAAGETVLVYSLPDRKLHARVPGARSPRFQGSERILVRPVWFEFQDGPRTVRHYAITADGLKYLPEAGWDLTGAEEHLGSRYPTFVTVSKSPRHPSPFPNWTPNAIRDALDHYLGFDRAQVTVRLHDLSTRKVIASSSIPRPAAPDRRGVSTTFLSPFNNVAIKVSRDGEYVMLQDSDALELWQLRDRPAGRWTLYALGGLVALGIAWPRKGKPPAPTRGNDSCRT